jgi:tRNA modification GTPase
MQDTSQTICALSTAPGVGAIALIRLSGKEALSLVSTCCGKDLTQVPTHTAHFARFRDTSGKVLDEVVITVFKDGKSFTGENTAEIACHGSTYIQQMILKTLLERGCRMAAPGEFTMRAFMNGKMDLSQAEAVADLIASESSKAHEVAMNQMRGSFSHELKDLREKLIHFASMVELELDFAEEDVEFADRTELRALVDEVLAYIAKLIRSFELGNVLKNGVPVAIVGAPNTGKSTLLNQLLGEERAIVSNIAGTTRDVIEETLNIDGILFRLIDTAGIREGADTIEAIGIERSHQKIQQAKIVIVMCDFGDLGSAVEDHLSMGPIEAMAWADTLVAQYPEKRIVVVGNKADLRPANQDALGYNCKATFIPLSAKTGEGMHDLTAWLSEQVLGDFNTQTDTIVSNARHLEALQRAQSSLTAAKNGLESGITGDFVAMDIRQASFDLGSITGDISTEDLLGNIFAKFCIGK